MRRKYARPYEASLDAYPAESLLQGDVALLHHLVEHPDPTVSMLALRALEHEEFSALVPLLDRLKEIGDDSSHLVELLAGRVAGGVVSLGLPGFDPATGLDSTGEWEAWHQQTKQGQDKALARDPESHWDRRGILDAYLENRMPSHDNPQKRRSKTHDQSGYATGEKTADGVLGPAYQKRTYSSRPLSRLFYDRSPAGGVIVRGLHYPGGKFIPKSGEIKASFDAYSQIERERQEAVKYQRADGSYCYEEAQEAQEAAKYARKTEDGRVFDEAARRSDDPKSDWGPPGHHSPGKKGLARRFTEEADQAEARHEQEQPAQEAVKNSRKGPAVARNNDRVARGMDDPKHMGHHNQQAKEVAHDLAESAEEHRRRAAEREQPAQEARRRSGRDRGERSSNLGTERANRTIAAQERIRGQEQYPGGPRSQGHQSGKEGVDQVNDIRGRVARESRRYSKRSDWRDQLMAQGAAIPQGSPDEVATWWQELQRLAIDTADGNLANIPEYEPEEPPLPRPRRRRRWSQGAAGGQNPAPPQQYSREALGLPPVRRLARVPMKATRDPWLNGQQVDPEEVLGREGITDASPQYRQEPPSGGHRDMGRPVAMPHAGRLLSMAGGQGEVAQMVQAALNEGDVDSLVMLLDYGQDMDMDPEDLQAVSDFLEGMIGRVAGAYRYPMHPRQEEYERASLRGRSWRDTYLGAGQGPQQYNASKRRKYMAAPDDYQPDEDVLERMAQQYEDEILARSLADMRRRWEEEEAWRARQQNRRPRRLLDIDRSGPSWRPIWHEPPARPSQVIDGTAKESLDGINDARNRRSMRPATP